MSKATANGKPRRDRGEIMDEMPPNALDSERALLSGVLYLGSINSDISIPPHEFYDGRNQAIWETLVSLNGEGLRIDEAAYLSGLKNIDVGDSMMDSIPLTRSATSARPTEVLTGSSGTRSRFTPHTSSGRSAIMPNSCCKRPAQLASCPNWRRASTRLRSLFRSTARTRATAAARQSRCVPIRSSHRKIRWCLRVRFHLPSTGAHSDTPVSVNRFLCVTFPPRVSRGFLSLPPMKHPEPATVMVQAEDDPEDTRFLA